MTDNSSTAIVVRNPPHGVALPAPPSIAGVTGQLPEVLQLCNAIAAAGELIPLAYRGKPGAVLLAKMWADRHDIDLFTAVQQIFPIDGKPYVAAAMRVTLATAKGFDLRVTESTREVCTLEVWRDGEKRGEVTSRYDDAPRKEKTPKGAPTPWALHPDDMLFADACRKADRRYVQTAAALLDSAQDYADDEPDDALDVIAAEQPAEQPAEPDTVSDRPLPTEADTMTGEGLRALIDTHPVITVPKALRGIHERFPDAKLGTLDDVAGDPEALDWILDLIEGGEQAKETECPL